MNGEELRIVRVEMRESKTQKRPKRDKFKQADVGKPGIKCGVMRLRVVRDVDDASCAK